MADASEKSDKLLGHIRGLDALYAPGDVSRWLTDAFFLPGDEILRLMTAHALPLARGLGVHDADSGGMISAVISGTTWFLIALITACALRSAWHFVISLGYAIAWKWNRIRQRVRAAQSALGYRLRLRPRRSRERRKYEPAMVSEETDLSPADVLTLSAHASLGPGQALTLSDIAAAASLPRHESGRLVQRLVKLGFLATSLSGSDGEEAYYLTGAGRAYLVFSRIELEKTPADVRTGAATLAAN